MRSFTYKIQQKLIDRSNGQCYICKLPIDLQSFQKYVAWKRKWKNKIKTIEPHPRRGKIDVNIDHILPVSKGGEWRNY